MWPVTWFCFWFGSRRVRSVADGLGEHRPKFIAGGLTVKRSISRHFDHEPDAPIAPLRKDMNPLFAHGASRSA